MSRLFTGYNGDEYKAKEPPIGKGGEGTIYEIEGNSKYVLKIYNENKDSLWLKTKEAKIEAMLRTPLSQDAMEQVTWPIDIVKRNGQFSGYVMLKVQSNVALNVIYSNQYKMPLDKKIIICKNLCAALHAVHQAGQVVGDLNPNNIDVNPQTGLITLLDTDSYHIEDYQNGRTFRCQVGVPEYLPKEIQQVMKNGADLMTAPLPTFTIYSDLFALAVHIFALLMNGCHPFACAVDKQLAYQSKVAPQPIENIAQGFFPFYQKAEGIVPPMYAPDFKYLPDDIQQLFIRAFVKGNTNPKERPSEEKWYLALNKMQANLISCNRNQLHLYPENNAFCPWCQVKYRMQSINKRVVNKNSTSSSQHTASQKVHSAASPYQSKQNNTTQGSSAQNSSDTATASQGWFVLFCFIVSIIFQIIGSKYFYGILADFAFGASYKSPIILYLGRNLGVLLNNWGFVVSGLIAAMAYAGFLMDIVDRNSVLFLSLFSVIADIVAIPSYILLIFILDVFLRFILFWLV